MFGIRHDDYDYNEVNQLMERSLKAYIKTVTCFPERVVKKDYDSFMKEFKHSEKVNSHWDWFTIVGEGTGGEGGRGGGGGGRGGGRGGAYTK